MSPAAKRKIVRGFTLLPLLLCVLGLLWSYVHTEWICYTGSGRDSSAEIAMGELVLWSGATTRAGSGWSYVHMHPNWEIGELYTGLPDLRFLGIHLYCGAHPYSPGVTAMLLVVPFWILCIAAGLAPALLWWRGRKNLNACGFPLEETETGAKWTK